jgi:hypothetical protein
MVKFLSHGEEQWKDIQASRVKLYSDEIPLMSKFSTILCPYSVEEVVATREKLTEVIDLLKSYLEPGGKIIMLSAVPDLIDPLSIYRTLNATVYEGVTYTTVVLARMDGKAYTHHTIPESHLAYEARRAGMLLDKKDPTHFLNVDLTLPRKSWMLYELSLAPKSYHLDYEFFAIDDPDEPYLLEKSTKTSVVRTLPELSPIDFLRTNQLEWNLLPTKRGTVFEMYSLGTGLMNGKKKYGSVGLSNLDHYHKEKKDIRQSHLRYQTDGVETYDLISEAGFSAVVIFSGRRIQVVDVLSIHRVSLVKLSRQGRYEALVAATGIRGLEFAVVYNLDDPNVRTFPDHLPSTTIIARQPVDQLLAFTIYMCPRICVVPLLDLSENIALDALRVKPVPKILPKVQTYYLDEMYGDDCQLAHLMVDKQKADFLLATFPHPLFATPSTDVPQDFNKESSFLYYRHSLYMGHVRSQSSIAKKTIDVLRSYFKRKRVRDDPEILPDNTQSQNI